MILDMTLDSSIEDGDNGGVDDTDSDISSDDDNTYDDGPVV